MKRYLLLLLFGTICLHSQAQFSGIYSPSGWTTFWLYPTNGSVNTSGAPASITITGDNDCGGDFDQFVQYSIPSPYCGTLSFTYTWTNSDVEEFYYAINTSYVLVSSSSSSGTIGPISVAAGDVISFIINSPGLSDCGGTGTLTISNFVAPTAPFTLNASASQTTGCPGSVISVFGTPSTSASNYAWSTGSSGPTDSVLVTLTSDTLISVTATEVGSGCLATDSIFIDMVACSGMDEYDQDLAKIYPNPASDFLYVNSEFENMDFNICDIQGKIVLNGFLGSDQFIPIQMLEKGIYILSLSNKNSIQRTRFLKE